MPQLQLISLYPFKFDTDSIYYNYCFNRIDEDFFETISKSRYGYKIITQTTQSKSNGARVVYFQRIYNIIIYVCNITFASTGNGQ